MRDGIWVKRILAGDKSAGTRFVTENYPRIYRLLRHLSGNPETAKDLTQQTFTAAWQGLATYKGEATLATWLHHIAYHEFTHWLRARRDHVSLDDAADVADIRGAPNLEMIGLPGALNTLPSDLRVTFCLYYLQELSISEVATVLEIPDGTVKSRLSAARGRLREILGEALISGDTRIMGPAPEV